MLTPQNAPKLANDATQSLKSRLVLHLQAEGHEPREIRRAMRDYTPSADALLEEMQRISSKRSARRVKVSNAEVEQELRATEIALQNLKDTDHD